MLCAAPCAPAQSTASALPATGAHHARMFRGTTPRTVKALPAARAAANTSAIINPAAVKNLRSAAKAYAGNLPEGVLLWESFENLEHQGDLTWLPEGWTAVSYGDGDLETGEKWAVDMQSNPNIPGPADGDFYAGINFSTKNQDEWLVSPSVALPADRLYQLSFFANVDPLFFYVLDGDHVDWDTYEFTDQVVTCNFQILVSADGGEFEVVRDFANEFMGYSMMELMELSPVALQKYSVDLTGYEGKNIKVAFRYVGTDGNTLFLDAVSIALPAMDLVIHAPAETLYWGLDCSSLWTYMQLSIAQYPVYSPFVFSGEAAGSSSKVNLGWLYCDPETTDMVSAPGDELTLEYHTDYSSAFTTRNNLYYPPVLLGSAEGYSDTEVTFNADYLQAGGKACFVMSDGSEFNGGLLPFDINTSEIGGYTICDDKLGDLSLPVFGHNANTTAYWTDYTFRGDAGPGDLCELTQIMNYYTPSASPLVVDKVWLNAIGFFEPDAEFTCSIIPMLPYYEDGEYMGDVFGDAPVAVATVLGKDVTGYDPTSTGKLYLCLPFTFDTPVVLSAGDAKAYMICISGFNSPKVEYFCPMQQWIPNDEAFATGWVAKDITFTGQTRTTFNPLAYYENEYGPMFCAFAINLGGTYPWLEAATTDLVLDDNGTCSVALDSYYDATELTVTCPQWTEVTLSGRYGDARLSVLATDYTDDSLGSITVSGPGVKKTFAVGTPAGAAAIRPDGPDAAITDVYTATGVRVGSSANVLPAGVYITRHADGTARKIAIQ